jgi:hypothetical protein
MSEAAQQTLFRIGNKIREANELVRHFPGVTEVFPETSLTPPNRTVPAELGFIRSVSWAFVLLHEAGRASVKLLEGFTANARPSERDELNRNLELVNELRTFLQHDLERTSLRNAALDARCAGWFKESCGTAVPSTEEEWAACLLKFLERVEKSLEILVRSIREIEKHAAATEIFQTWSVRKKRTWAPYDFDSLIAGIASDLGRVGVDVVRFRKRYADRWIRALELLSEQSDPKIEIRKLIEFALINDDAHVLPITGDDLMNAFGIPPGPVVGKLLREAKSLYDHAPCSGPELLTRLRNSPRIKELLPG